MATVNVYRVVNRPRRESLIALCADPPGLFRLRLRARPQAVLHWALAEELEFECLAERMPVADAEAFVARFLKTMRSPGWRLLSCRC